MTLESVPPDFPTGTQGGAVPGAQPKLLARIEGGQFVASHDEADVQTRYAMCEDLSYQLVAYAARKRSENPQWPDAQVLDKVAHAVRQKAFGWGLSPAETQWVLGRVATMAHGAISKDNE